MEQRAWIDSGPAIGAAFACRQPQPLASCKVKIKEAASLRKLEVGDVVELLGVPTQAGTARCSAFVGHSMELSDYNLLQQ